MIARSRAVRCVAFFANSSAIGCKKDALRPIPIRTTTDSRGLCRTSLAVLDGGVELVRGRKVVRVLVAHKVQRHLRQRALKVPQAGRQALLCQWGAAGLPANQSGMKKHREGAEPSRCFAMICIAASAC